jgi:fatty-acyl-CoA synthase
MANPYEQNLDKNPANYQPLTPITYLERAAKTFPNHVAIIHGAARITYGQFWTRSLKLASVLAKRGIGKGDTVSVMLSNTPPMLEAHFGAPMGEGGSALAEHAPRCCDHRLPARPCRFESADR